VVAADRELDAGLLGSARNRAEVERSLLEITARAAANADGDVGVGLSILVQGAVQSIGATTPAAQQMDSGQAVDGDGPCLHALSSGESVTVTDYAADARWPGTSRRAATAGVRSSLSLPLKTPGDVVLGALNVYSDLPEAFSAEVGVSLGAFAQQATTSLSLLGELQEQREDSAYVTAFTRTVQSSLRAVLPSVDGLELMGGSVPSAAHASVGGDWHDALVLPDDSVAVVIGDVMGHGIAAVTAMAQLRTMVRAGAWLGNTPAQVIAMTDELAELTGITETATLFFGRLTRSASGGRLEYCNAGHLHPLVRDPGGLVRVLSGGSRMLVGALGTGAGPVPTVTAAAELPSGSILLLYTDGLVERPGVDIDDATAQLSRTLSGFDTSASLKQLCRQLLDAPGARDDSTVFMVRIR
jgi:serine phosphatase RsbU (regulator of sigma subunit)